MPGKLQRELATSQPEVVLWLELPGSVVVSLRVIDPESPLRFEETLAEAMRDPVEGPARTPRRIRVPDQALADALAGTIGPETTVVVAPVPELDTVFAQIMGGITTVDIVETYLADGDIPAGVVAGFFSAASAYYRAAPWHDILDREVVRIDIPALGVEGRCLSIIGAAGEGPGFVLHPSVEDFVAFSTRPVPIPTEEALRKAPPPPESRTLSLSFERKKELPPSLLEEIEEHGWEVASANAYPYVTALDVDVLEHSTTEHDYRIVTACMRAFLAFFAGHLQLFRPHPAEATSVSFDVGDSVTVTITAPYESELIKTMLDDRLSRGVVSG